MSETNLSDSNQLGDWSALHTTFSRQVKMLFKKQFTIKIRKWTSILEYLASFAIIYISYITSVSTKIKHHQILNPVIEKIPKDKDLWLLDKFLFYSEPTIVGVPDHKLVHELFNNTYYLKKFIEKSYFAFQKQIKIHYVNNEEDMEKLIYENDNGAIAVHWINVNDDNCLKNPKIRIYTQMNKLIPAPEKVIYQDIRDALALMNRGTNASHLRTLKNESFYGSQKFSRNEYTTQANNGLRIAFFSVIIIILSTMSDFNNLFEEKNTHVAALSFLMGCSERAYWFVSFLTPFLLSLGPYLVLSITLCFIYGMKGTNFFLFLVVTILFIFSHIWFQMFISTFFKKGSSIIVVFLVLELFFSFLHQFFTLSDDNPSVVLMHVFCIIPFSAYEIFIMSGHTQCINELIPYTWSTLTYNGYECQPYIPLLWLLIDSVVFLFLFLFFNATLKRDFGTNLIRFKEIIKKDTWKEFFSRSSLLKIAPESDNFIEVSGLTKVYNSHKKITALNNVNFHICTGEVIILIGPNGSGKSTLINILSGAIEPTSGKMKLFDGNETERFSETQSYLGVCFQDNVLINLLSVKEHFELFGAFRGIPEDTLESCIKFLSKQLQLEHMLDNRAGDLSGGQKRKLCIGLSLLGNPPIVIMDEPTAGVDVQARQLIWKMIASLKNTTSIIASHSLEEAETISSRLFILSGGKIRFCGNSTELRSQYKCGYLLRVEKEDGNMESILQLLHQYIPEGYIQEERPDTITIPVSPKIPEFLHAFDMDKERLGVTSYSLFVEQIEDMLLKLIQSEEAKG